MSEKVTVKVERSVLHLPAIALRGLVVFPNNLLHFEVGREKSIAAVEWAVSNNSDVFLVAQKEMKVEDPKAADLYTYGVVAEVKQVMRVSDDLVRILVEGKYRAKLSEMEDDGSFLLATVRPAPVKMAKPEELPEADVLVRNVKKSFDDLLALNPHIGKDVVFAITTSTDAAFLSEYIPANLLFRFEDKQAILDEGTLMGRLHLLIEKMHRERRMLEIDKEIAQKVDEAMDKNQRDYYLHEQLHMISEELGEDDEELFEYAMHPAQYEAYKSGKAKQDFLEDVEKRRAERDKSPLDDAKPKTLTVQVDGQAYRVTVAYGDIDLPASATEKVTAPPVGEGQDVPAPLEGKFFLTKNAQETPLKVGDKVKSGDLLCYIEAMKTYNAIRADFDGTVVAICVNPGDSVSEDDVLMKIG